MLKLPAGPRTEAAVVALACAGSFVVILDATIVSVALPAIRAALGFPAEALPWVVNAYVLVFAGLLLFGGRLADVFGRRRIYLAGMGLFTAARLAAGLAPSAGLLLGARAVQGIGGALLMPVTLSLLTTTFPEPARRARVLGTWSAVGALAAASGPVLGGVLTGWAGWRWVFFVSVPVGALAMVGAATMLGEGKDPARPRLDLVGACLATVGLVGVVYAVTRSSAAGWAGAEVLTTLLGGLAALGLFLWHQARWSPSPLLAPAIFRIRAVAAGNLVMFLLGLGFFATPVLLSLYLQDVHGYSPLGAGLAQLPFGLAMFTGARLAGPLTVRFGARIAATMCCLCGAAGFILLALLSGVDTSYLGSVLLPGVLLGFGTAAAFTPITVAATTGVPERHSGLAAGLLNTVRQTSGAIGLAALSALAAAVTAHHLTAQPRDSLAHGYTAAFTAAAGCVVAAAVLAALLLPRRR